MDTNQPQNPQTNLNGHTVETTEVEKRGRLHVTVPLEFHKEMEALYEATRKENPDLFKGRFFGEILQTSFSIARDKYEDGGNYKEKFEAIEKERTEWEHDFDKFQTRNKERVNFWKRLALGLGLLTLAALVFAFFQSRNKQW